MKKLYLILLGLFLTTSVFAQEGLQKVKIDDFSGGQNSFYLSDIIEMNQGESMKNIILNKKGQLSKRTGQTLFIASNSTTAFRGIGRFDPDQNTSYMMVASPPSVIRAESSSTSWTEINSGYSQSAGYDTEFIQANNNLFVFNGQDATSWYDGSVYYKGTSGGSTSPPTATTAAWLNNYLFLGGNPTHTDWIYVSDNLTPTIFTVASNIMKINTGDGQAVKRLETFREKEIIVYKERSIFLMDISGTTMITDWTVTPISKSVGCVAPRSVVSLGNDQWFLSSEPYAVRSLVRSQFDKILVDMVSTPIQDIFNGTGTITINKTQISKSCAILYDNKYLLAIPTGTSTINNTVCVFDFITNSWYIIDGWYPAEWVVFNDNLYYIDANIGSVIQCFTGTTGDIGNISASTPTVAIEYEYISKSIDFDNPENYKQLDALEIEFETAGNYTATIYINLDKDGWQNIGTINLSGSVITLPVTLPFTLKGSGVARKTFHLQRYGEFKKMQIKVVQNGLDELCNLHRITVFALVKPWRREN